jgi:hypothetical protein
MNRKSGIIAATALTSFIFCGAATTTQGCNQSQQSFGSIGPSTGEVVGAIVGVAAVITVGTIVLVEVHNAHHTIKGCVTAGPAGIQVQNEGDKKMYTVTGVTKDVKVGDRVKVHGDKEKKQKGSTADQVFTVEKMNKNYGPCQVAPSTASTISTAANTNP